MSEYDNKPYEVSFIASAPDEFKVGDRVEVVDENDALYKQQGIVIDIQEDGDIYVKFHTSKHVKYKLSQLRKLPDTPEELKVGDMVEVVGKGYVSDMYIGKVGKVKTIPIDGNVFVDFGDMSLSISLSALRKINKEPNEDSDNVKAFKAILNEMAETYARKNECYGNAYQDGFRRFGAVQLVSRMYEKYCRIENLLVRNADNKVPDESVIDTITDLGVQCVVLRMLLQKNDFENAE